MASYDGISAEYLPGRIRRLRQMGGAGNNVDVNCVHPGIVDTELPRNMKIDFYPQMRSAGMLITPDQGARGQAGGVLRTTTLPMFNLLLLRRACV